MTEAQVTAINTAITGLAGDVLDGFVSLLPAIAGAVAIGFVIYTVRKLVQGLGRGKVRA